MGEIDKKYTQCKFNEFVAHNPLFSLPISLLMANRHVRIRGELRAARRLFPVASAAPSQPSAKRTSVTGSHLAVVGNGLEVGGPAWLGPSLGFPDLGADLR